MIDKAQSKFPIPDGKVRVVITEEDADNLCDKLKDIQESVRGESYNFVCPQKDDNGKMYLTVRKGTIDGTVQEGDTVFSSDCIIEIDISSLFVKKGKEKLVYPQFTLNIMFV